MPASSPARLLQAPPPTTPPSRSAAQSRLNYWLVKPSASMTTERSLAPPRSAAPTATPMSASLAGRPLPISTPTAILISSSAMTTATRWCAPTPPRQAPQLPPTALHPSIPSGSVMSASPPARPLPISTATAILISSSAITTATRWCSPTPPHQVPQLPPTALHPPIPSASVMSASPPARPWPISTATAILISSSAIATATRWCSPTPPRQALQLPPTALHAPTP